MLIKVNVTSKGEVVLREVVQLMEQTRWCAKREGDHYRYWFRAGCRWLKLVKCLPGATVNRYKRHIANIAKVASKDKEVNLVVHLGINDLS